MKAVITGATGFIGSNLVRRLIKENWEVYIIVRPTSKLDLIIDIADKIHLITYYPGRTNLARIFNRIKPDIVFHLASKFISEHKRADITSLVNSNILFANHIVDAMIEAGIYKLINTGTSWQHYQNEDYNPVNLYAATKQAFETILKFYIESTPLKVITLKLSDSYGPGDPRKKLVNILKNSASSDCVLNMSPGHQEIDLVYIDDIIDAYLQAANLILKSKDNIHNRYMISSGKPITIRNLVKLISRIYKKKIKINWGGREYRKREVMKSWDMGKALPGWEPKISIQKGLNILFTDL